MPIVQFAAVQVVPAGGVTVPIAYPAGNISATATLVALFGPLLVTVKVNVTIAPGNALVGVTVLITLTSVAVQIAVFKLTKTAVIEPVFPLVAPFAGNSTMAVVVLVPFTPPLAVLVEASVVAFTDITPPPPPPPQPSASVVVISWSPPFPPLAFIV